jgi:hypothetical protein
LEELKNERSRALLIPIMPVKTALGRSTSSPAKSATTTTAPTPSLPANATVTAFTGGGMFSRGPNGKWMTREEIDLYNRSHGINNTPTSPAPPATTTPPSRPTSQPSPPLPVVMGAPSPPQLPPSSTSATTSTGPSSASSAGESKEMKEGKTSDINSSNDLSPRAPAKKEKAKKEIQPPRGLSEIGAEEKVLTNQQASIQKQYSEDKKENDADLKAAFAALKGRVGIFDVKYVTACC